MAGPTARKAVDKQARKNAFVYCQLRDKQFSLYDAFAKRHGMLTNTLLVVNALFYAKEGLTQRDICERTFESKQTVSLIVGRLKREGHATVEACDGDRREKVVRMTEAGRLHYEEPIRHITWAEDTAMSMFSDEEQETLNRLSRQFTERLAELFDQEGVESDG